MLLKDYCKLEAIKYVAFRYGTTPEQVLEHYLVQTGIIKSSNKQEDDYNLTPNEIALFNDLGISTSIDFSCEANTDT